MKETIRIANLKKQVIKPYLTKRILRDFKLSDEVLFILYFASCMGLESPVRPPVTFSPLKSTLTC